MKYELIVSEDSHGLCDVKGFQLAGVSCDIRNKNNDRLDLALIKSCVPATAAGVFTTNDVKAAPVLVDVEHLWKSPTISAVVANSGNANACTGERGLKDSREMCSLVAKKLKTKESEILVCSTGRIGEFMPMEKISKGINKAFEVLSDSKEQSVNASEAILTSDTRKKTISVKVKCGKQEFNIAGMAKGAGMIEPNMATMLCFIASDVKISQQLLKSCLAKSVGMTFNCITVDGDMSTNDTVLVLCNGESGVEITEQNKSLFEAFSKALEKVCAYLARHIVADGERITKVVQVNILSARDEAQAEKVAKAIANSLLVKSSWYGSDPNWGRLADAAGYARTGIVFEKMDLNYDGIEVLNQGSVVEKNKELWKKAVAKKEFVININLNLGKASWTVLTTDLSEGYVDFNKGE